MYINVVLDQESGLPGPIQSRFDHVCTFQMSSVMLLCTVYVVAVCPFGVCYNLLVGMLLDL